MIEYRDGSFGDIVPTDEAVNQLMTQEQVNIAALHVGTKEQLEQVKEKRNLENEIDELKAKVDKLEKPSSKVLSIPNSEEIKQFGVNNGI